MLGENIDKPIQFHPQWSAYVRRLYWILQDTSQHFLSGFVLSKNWIMKEMLDSCC